MDCKKAGDQSGVDGLGAYEHRHGWKGQLEDVLAQGIVPNRYQHADWDSEPEVNGYIHALVTGAGTGIATLRFGRYTAAIGQPDVACTRQKIHAIIKLGDISYIKILTLSANGAAPV